MSEKCSEARVSLIKSSDETSTKIEKSGSIELALRSRKGKEKEKRNNPKKGTKEKKSKKKKKKNLKSSTTEEDADGEGDDEEDSWEADPPTFSPHHADKVPAGPGPWAQESINSGVVHTPSPNAQSKNKKRRARREDDTDNDDSEGMDPFMSDTERTSSPLLPRSLSSPAAPQSAAPEPLPDEVLERVMAMARQMGEAQITRCQSFIRRALARQHYNTLLKMSKKRSKIVAHLLATEQTYVADLSLVVEVFLNPLRESLASREHSILPSETTLRSLFSDIEVIRNYNTILLEQLQKRYANWFPYQKIGDVFRKMNHFLKAYNNYCTHYKEALRTLGELNRNPRFTAFLKNAAKTAGLRGRGLGDFLHMPVGRIPCYRDTLRRLVRHTWTTHNDLPDLIDAAAAITDLASYVADSQTDVDNILEVLKIQNSLTNTQQNIVTLTRRLVREGELEEIPMESEDFTQVVGEANYASSNSKSKTRWYLFLFNDLLLWAQPLPPKGKQVNDESSFTEAAEMSLSRDSFLSQSRSLNDQQPQVGGRRQRYHVHKMQDLVRLTVSEIPMHPLNHSFDAVGFDWGIKIVDQEGETAVLRASDGGQHRNWISALYSCIDDAVSQLYLRFVEVRKQVVHQELLELMHKDDYFAYLRSLRLRRNKTKGAKSKPKRGGSMGIGRIIPMARRLSDAPEESQPRDNITTHHNPLAAQVQIVQNPLRRPSIAMGQHGMSGGGVANAMPSMTLPVLAMPMSGPTLPEGDPLSARGTPPGGHHPAMRVLGGVGIVNGVGVEVRLHKSSSVTQLDLLMAEMKNNPRALYHLAPKLEHTMQRIHDNRPEVLPGGGKEKDKESFRARLKDKPHKIKDKEKDKDSKASSFKRSLSLKLRGEKKFEKNDRERGDVYKGKEKEREKAHHADEEEREKERDNNNNKDRDEKERERERKGRAVAAKADGKVERVMKLAKSSDDAAMSIASRPQSNTSHSSSSSSFSYSSNANANKKLGARDKIKGKEE